MPLFRNKNQSKERDNSPRSIEQWVTETYIEGVNSLAPLRESSKKWYDFVAGDMIDDQTAEDLKKRGLPALKLNIVLPKVLRILGAERQARAGIKAVPLSRGRNDTAKALTKLFEMIRVNSDGHREVKDAFMDAVISDLGGWLEVLWTNDNDPLGQPIYRRVNPFYVVWDVKSKRYDLSDSRWIMKTWWATKDDILRDFPEKRAEVDEMLEEFGRGYWSTFVHDAWERIRGVRTSQDWEFVDQRENLFRVIEAQRREEITETRLYDPETQSTERPEDKEELEAMKKQFPRLIEVDFKWDKIRVITTVAGDTLLLQDVDADVQNGMFSLIPMWAYTFGDRSFGIVKNLEGPQELYWKEISSELHITNLTANPIWMVPKGSVSQKQLKDLQEYGARAGLVVETDPAMTGGQVPRRDVVNLGNTAHAQLHERARVIGEEVTGIGQNAVGRSDTSSESGELVKTRVGETLAMIESLFDNKMRTETLLHKYLIGVAQNKLTAMRIIRWIGDNQTPQQLILNQITAHGILNDMKEGEYGIAMERAEAQYFRQEKFLKLLSLSQAIGATPELIKLIIESFDDIDEEAKEQLVKAYTAQMMGPELQQLEQNIRQSSDQNYQRQLGERQQQEQQRAKEQEDVDKQIEALERAAA